MNKILVILGPTSSGKSDIAIKLAKKFNGEIISADSRQVYRGMDIGTGKIERDKITSSSSYARGEMFRLAGRRGGSELWTSRGIPHHMIDIVSPRTNYNIAKFKRQAKKIIEDILRRGKLPIICGGTGFWIKAIVDDVNFPEVKPDWKMRKKLEKYSANKLFSTLKRLDPQRARTIDSKNKVRLIRAIEICKAISKVPAIPAPKHHLLTTKYNFLQIGIKLSKYKLYKNIEKRVLIRFKQGMIDEVKKLHNKEKLSWKKIQSFGLAYFWIPLFLQNKLLPKLGFEKFRRDKAAGGESRDLVKEELIRKIIQVEKNYAKRQITWFKRDKRIKWLKNYKEIENQTKNFLKQNIQCCKR